VDRWLPGWSGYLTAICRPTPAGWSPGTSTVVRWVGIVLFTCGGALRPWLVYVRGDRFSGLFAIQIGNTLITRGVNGVIRHLSYLRLLINSLGWDQAFRSGFGVLLTALIMPPLVARNRAEVRLLHTQFGDAYCARIWWLVARLHWRFELEWQSGVER
jgi:protein-S-isoprenylcysteine O-methyltransferase Ste14